MHDIVVSDIFGKTPVLERLCEPLGGDVDLVDPYEGKYMGFQTQEQAYEFFMGNVGLKTYCDILQSRIENTSSPVMLTGFSVGASAIWQISASLTTEKVKRTVCFYGSQIRHHLDIEPNVVVELVMPMYEPGFSIDELVTCLSERKNVVIYNTPYLHGFMNEFSTNYNKLGYAKYLDWLRQRSG
jgi:dienelactone hydrolase